eukprot:COSAG06_NODE_858_length_11909_cov_6.018036_11_plen_351_part_00
MRHFILKSITLPRQARDKHRDTTQKRSAFLQAAGSPGSSRGASASRTHPQRWSSPRPRRKRRASPPAPPPPPPPPAAAAAAQREAIHSLQAAAAASVGPCPRSRRQTCRSRLTATAPRTSGATVARPAASTTRCENRCHLFLMYHFSIKNKSVLKRIDVPFYQDRLGTSLARDGLGDDCLLAGLARDDGGSDSALCRGGLHPQRLIRSHAVRKTKRFSFWRCLFDAKRTPTICQDRLGTNIEKLDKKARFCLKGIFWRFRRCSRSRMWRRTPWCSRARNGASIWRTLRLSFTTTLGPSLTLPFAKVREPFKISFKHTVLAYSTMRLRIPNQICPQIGVKKGQIDWISSYA